MLSDLPMKVLQILWLALALIPISTAASPHIQVVDAWVRATVPGQQATGAFMKITASTPVRLLSMATHVANINEIHEMKMDNGIMRMRAHLGGLDIPSKTTVELKPGGYHMMMMDLTRTLLPGQTVPLELRFTDAKGMQYTVSVNARTSFKDPYSK